MTETTVRPVRGAAMQRDFLQLAWDLYRDDPNWVPPLEDNIRELVGFRPHPFYNAADGQAFVAYQDDRPVGRILAVVNHAHNERYRERRGFVGFYECVDDSAASAALFDRARQWLDDRGARKVRGPMNPSMNYECGLLTEGYDSPPVFMMTYNPPYYARLWEEYGFRKTKDLYAYLGRKEFIPKSLERLTPLVEACQERMSAVVRHMDPARFPQEVRMFLDLYNKAMGDLWGFVPLSRSEVEAIAKSMEYLVVPQLGVVVEVEGRPVGCMLAMLDYNPRVKEIGGRLWPFGFLKLLRDKSEIKQVRLLSINVLPEYQSWGLGVVLLHDMLKIAQNYDVQTCEFSWVLEDNRLAVRGLEKGGALLYKKYRIYDYGPTESF